MNVRRTRWFGDKRVTVVLGLSLLLARAEAQDPAIGLHYGSDQSRSQYESFSNWLGRDVQYRVVFLGKRTWSDIANPFFLHVTKKWVNSRPGRTEVISVPMLPDSESGSFGVINSGARDHHFRALAEAIKSAGVADRVIVRLGWEGNGDWYKWSFQKKPAAYRNAFRRIVQTMRKTAPELRFEFNISNLATRGADGAKWTEGYPGNDVVDVISMDIYDHWNTWDRMVNGDAGLAEMRAFAIKNNKPEAFAEWSCSTLKAGNGDSPAFISNMAAWMRARPGGVLYQAYWNSPSGAKGTIHGETVYAPKAAARYLKEFGPTKSTPPVISSIPYQSIWTNTDTGPIPFTIQDAETPAKELTLSAKASNPDLVPAANITFGGSGKNRTVKIKPVANRTGWSTIWIKVSDGKLSSVSSFVVNVSQPPQVNTAPAISAIGDRAVPVNGSSGPIAFTISDAETAAANLTLSTSSSNPSLMPESRITLGGSGKNRTVTLRPVSNKSGTTSIRITVSDGKLSRSTTFTVKVAPAFSYTDVGGPAIAGSHTVSGSTITIRAGGYDIYGKKDEFTFAQQAVAGDAELTVRVSSLTKAHAWTKAGLMFRSSLAADAAFVGVFVTPSQGVVLQWRRVDGGGSATSPSLPGKAPVWIRLLRSADSFFAFASHDGVTWDFVEAVDVNLPDSARAGLAVTSHAPNTATTAVFDGFAID